MPRSDPSLEEIRDFLAGRIDSVQALYVLLLLQRDPTVAWTGSAVGSELRIGADVADQLLAKLCAVNLLEVRVGKDLLYRFAPRLAFLEQGARTLARAYAREPSAVIAQIGKQRAPEP